MPSNLTLSADERTLWMMARGHAQLETAMAMNAAALNGVSPRCLTNDEADAAADAAIRALRERVAVEATWEATNAASGTTGEAEQ